MGGSQKPIYAISDGAEASAAGPSCYAVRGFGEKQPLRVQLTCPSNVSGGISICEEEMRLIAAAIESRRIPVPSALSHERPNFSISVDRLRPPNDATRIFKCSPGYVPRGRWWRGIRRPLSEWANALFKMKRFAGLADELAERKPAGKVVVVGDDARAAAWLLRVRGLTASHVEAVAEPGVLPKRKSLAHWLRHNDIGELGALVLIGDHDFDADCEALADAEVAPLIIRAALDERQTAQIVDVNTPKVHDREFAEWPRISVITVSFNQAKYLEASIRSVLDQNYPNLEYIIVDGDSTDGSVEIIERYREKCSDVIVEPDRGQSDALNKGFALATGEIMGWLCSDDLLEPGSLERVAKTYLRHDADLIIGGCVRVGETRDQEFYRHHAALPFGRTVRLMPLDILQFMRSWQAGNYFFQPEVFFSRRVWMASGAYIKEHLFYAMDYDLWLRMALAGATARHIPVMIGCSRIHDQQKTQDNRMWFHQMLPLMEEYKELFQALRAAPITPSVPPER